MKRIMILLAIGTILPISSMNIFRNYNMSQVNAIAAITQRAGNQVNKRRFCEKKQPPMAKHTILIEYRRKVGNESNTLADEAKDDKRIVFSSELCVGYTPKEAFLKLGKFFDYISHKAPLQFKQFVNCELRETLPPFSINYVPEKTPQIIEMESRRTPWTYSKCIFAGASITMLVYGILTGDIYMSIVQDTLHIEHGSFIAGSGWISYFSKYKEGLFKREMKEKITFIKVSELPERQRLNEDIKEANSDLAVHSVNYEIMEKIESINEELNVLNRFGKIHGDQKFAELSKKITDIRRLNN